MAQRSILIVDAARGPLTMVAENLRQAGCVVHHTTSPREGLQSAMETVPDVVVLSRVFGDEEMLGLCRSLLRNLSDDASPSILIAPHTPAKEQDDPAHDSRLAESLALDLLAQCVRTLTFRARQTTDSQAVLECHGIRIDPRFSTAEAGGARLDLTPTEFRLLHALLSRPGHVLTRAQLEGAAGLPAKERDSESEDEPGNRTRRIDVHVKSIRSKLADKGGLIETVRGVGYRLREPAWGLNSF